MKKYQERKFDNKLKVKLESTYTICDEHLNKYVLLLQKGVNCNKYMDSWAKKKCLVS